MIDNFQISDDEIIYCDSGFDPIGRIFYYSDKIFRIINTEHVDLVQSILNTDFFNELQNLNLMPKTKIANIEFGDNALILEHEKLIETSPSQWTFSMLKDAALCTLKVNKILNDHGYELKDAHPWNILFKNNSPVFIDFGSIKPITNKNKWVAQYEFIKAFVLPLMLWANGEGFFARKMLEASGYCLFTLPSYEVMKSKLVFKTIKYYRIILGSKLINRSTKSIINKKLVESLKSNYVVTPWNNYQKEFFNNSSNNKKNDEFIRFERIIDIVDELGDVNSILDLAGNHGVFSYRLKKRFPNIKKIINVDYDENSIDSAYNFCQLNGIKIGNYLLNFILPIDYNRVFASFKSDAVFALAVTHHLLLSQNVNIKLLFERIKSYSMKYVFIEFMPKGLWGGGDTELPVIPEYYTEEWFQQEFEKIFKLIKKEEIGNNRIIFVGILKE